MPCLPPGWRSDYDGKRWFYEYKATGHVQYHFPSEGDEFPDYVDALSPAPILAPEERLESQQQVKRQGGPYAGRPSAPVGIPQERILPWQSTVNNGRSGSRDWTGQMSATARPVNFAWEGDEEDAVAQKEEDAVFRPESFMFLGPGTYNDVSPLAEEEDETAKRIIAGDERSKGVSPDVSQGTTPLVKNSELKSPPTSPLAEPPATVTVTKEQETPLEPPSAIEEEPIIHMIDSREMPTELPGSEPWQDPVGRVAEMPTGDTPIARIETHPEPVEIGEGRELMEIGPSAPVVVAELSDGGGLEKPTDEDKAPAAKTPAVEDRKSSIPEQDHADPQPEKEVTATPGEGIARTRPVPSKELKETSKLDAVEEQTPGKPAPTSKYQPYKPGQVQYETPPRRSDEMATHQNSLQRERSLMMGPSSSGSQQLDLSAVPAALHVSNRKSIATDVTVVKQPRSPSPPEPTRDPSPLAREEQPDIQHPPHGVEKFPSVLRPARGRALSQPKTSENRQSVHEQAIADVQQHPLSMRPGQGHATHRSESRTNEPTISDTVTQPSAMPKESQYLPYREEMDQDSPVAQDMSPQPATALPVSISAMQKATLVTTRKAVPSRTGQSTEEQAPKASIPLGRAVYPPTHSPAASSPSQGPPPRERRHSSFSPSEVSSIASRTGSISMGTPLESPSPMEGMRRGSSGVSLAQSTGSGMSFTPSPPSLTPGSERPNMVSPLSGPPMRPGMPSNASDVSYFAQGAYANSQQQRQSPLPGLQRSQSMHQPPSPSQVPDAVGQSRDRMSMQSPPAPAHHLTSIEEHDEVVSSHDGRSLNSESPGLSRRHSLAASPIPSPGLPNQAAPVHLQGPAYQFQQTNYQGPPSGPTGPGSTGHLHHHRPNIPPQASHHIRHQVHGPSLHGPGPQRPHHMPLAHGPPMPPQGQPQHHIQPRRAPGGPQIVPLNNNFPPKLVSANTAPPTPKDKDKKWTKWFKSSKSSASGPQSTPPAEVPSPQPPVQPVPGQPMPWPSNHPIPQGPPPGSPQPPAPWSPNQIRPHLHHPLGQLPPQGNINKALPPANLGFPVRHQPMPPAPHSGPGPAPLPPQSGGPKPHRQSMPPGPVPSAGEPSRWQQRASGDYSGSGWNGGSPQWR